MSLPEQIQGKQAGPATDVYALGCVLYECLDRQLPTAATTTPRCCGTLVEPPPPVTAIRPELPGAVNVVVTRAMARIPSIGTSPSGISLMSSSRPSASPCREPRRPAGIPSPAERQSEQPTWSRTAPANPETGIVPCPADATTGPARSRHLRRRSTRHREGRLRTTSLTSREGPVSTRKTDVRDQEEQGSRSSAPAILAGPSPVGAIAGPRGPVSTRTPGPTGSQRRRWSRGSSSRHARPGDGCGRGGGEETVDSARPRPRPWWPNLPSPTGMIPSPIRRRPVA